MTLILAIQICHNSLSFPGILFSFSMFPFVTFDNSLACSLTFVRVPIRAWKPGCFCCFFRFNHHFNVLHLTERVWLQSDLVQALNTFSGSFDILINFNTFPLEVPFKAVYNALILFPLMATLYFFFRSSTVRFSVLSRTSNRYRSLTC